jgi:hypothetical protein
VTIHNLSYIGSLLTLLIEYSVIDPLLLSDKIPNIVSLPLLILNPCTVLVRPHTGVGEGIHIGSFGVSLYLETYLL